MEKMGMMFNPKYHRSKSIRLKEYDYTNPNLPYGKAGWYYVTICANDKVCCFGKVKNGKMILNDYGKIAEEKWLKTKEIRKNIDLDYYVVMPNHFHGIIIIESNVGAIQRIRPYEGNDNITSRFVRSDNRTVQIKG